MCYIIKLQKGANMSEWKFCNNNLVDLRKRKNISQRKAAHDMGFDRSVYYKHENGKSRPTVISLRKIAEYYGVPMEYFFKKTK